MSRHDPPSGDYYYASGKAVRLIPDEAWVAVDMQRSEVHLTQRRQRWASL